MQGIDEALYFFLLNVTATQQACFKQIIIYLLQRMDLCEIVRLQKSRLYLVFPKLLK